MTSTNFSFFFFALLLIDVHRYHLYRHLLYCHLLYRHILYRHLLYLHLLYLVYRRLLCRHLVIPKPTRPSLDLRSPSAGSRLSTFIPERTWTHVAMSYGNDGYERQYINGVQVDFRVLSRTQAILYQTMEPVTLGSNVEGRLILHGHLDEIVMFDRALQGTEIYRMFESLQTAQTLPTSPTARGGVRLATAPLSAVLSRAVGLIAASIDPYSVQTRVFLTFNISVACPYVSIHSVSFLLTGTQNAPIVTHKANPFVGRVEHCESSQVVLVLNDAFTKLLNVGQTSEQWIFLPNDRDFQAGENKISGFTSIYNTFEECQQKCTDTEDCTTVHYCSSVASGARTGECWGSSGVHSDRSNSGGIGAGCGSTLNAYATTYTLSSVVIDPVYPAQARMPLGLVAQYNFDGSYAKEDASGNNFVLRHTSQDFSKFSVVGCVSQGCSCAAFPTTSTKTIAW